MLAMFQIPNKFFERDGRVTDSRPGLGERVGRGDRRGVRCEGFDARLVARMEPPGLAFGEPEDRLRDIRERRPRISLRSMRATC